MTKLNFLLKFWKFYNRHLNILMLPFQQIIVSPEVLENIRNRKYRHHYLFPLIFNATILIDSLIIFLTVGNTPETPVLFFHVFQPLVPVFYLERASISHPCAIGLSCISNFVLFNDRFNHVPFLMLLQSNQLSMPYRKEGLKQVTKLLQAKLIKFHNWYRKFMKAYIRFLYIQLDLNFTIPFCLVEIYKTVGSNLEYHSNLRIALSLIACPLYLRTLVTSIHIGIQFISLNYIIQIKQKHYLINMEQSRDDSEPISGFWFYNRFCRTMAKLLDLTREINAYNRFYTMHVTFTTILFGLAGCSVLNAVMQAEADPSRVFKYIWITFSLIFLLFTFTFSACSSRTIFFNLKLFKMLRQTQTELLSKRQLKPYQVVKLDLVNEYKSLLQKCSFKLANSSMLSNKLFAFQIFGCVSVFYMKLTSET